MEFTNKKAAAVDGHLLEIYTHSPVRTQLLILTTSPLFVLVGEKHKGPLTSSQIPMRGCQEEPWRRKRKSKLPRAIVFICTEGRQAHSYHRAAGVFLYDTQRMVGQVSEAWEKVNLFLHLVYKKLTAFRSVLHVPRLPCDRGKLEEFPCSQV